MHPLEKVLGYEFQDKQLLIEALTHKSYKQPYNNERLEFLGDAVLDLVVGEYLFKRFPTSDEGKLSKIRASLVNEEGFNKLALSIDLGEHLFLSNAEENNDERQDHEVREDIEEEEQGREEQVVGGGQPDREG